MIRWIMKGAAPPANAIKKQPMPHWSIFDHKGLTFFQKNSTLAFLSLLVYV